MTQTTIARKLLPAMIILACSLRGQTNGPSTPVSLTARLALCSGASFHPLHHADV